MSTVINPPGKINCYTCATCGGTIVTVDRVSGVTPFMTRCRATADCKGAMQSEFYRVPQTLPPTFEWYRPDSLEGLSPETADHVERGGLLLRPIDFSNKSIAHRTGMNALGGRLYPDGLVRWEEASPPNLTGGLDEQAAGRLRACAYCGSMHPADVAAAIRAGAVGEWADKKYGWPHKAYFQGIPNPHAGLLESRAGATFEDPRYPRKVQSGFNSRTGEPTYMWHEAGRPASEKTDGKFYTVHLQDASPEDRATIERHLGLAFTFENNGAAVQWLAVPGLADPGDFEPEDDEAVDDDEDLNEAGTWQQ